MHASTDVDELDRAYSVGDHRTARALAERLLQRERDPEVEARARRVLHATEPDAFLTSVGVLGLGLLGWLVYNYVL